NRVANPTMTHTPRKPLGASESRTTRSWSTLAPRIGLALLARMLVSRRTGRAFHLAMGFAPTPGPRRDWLASRGPWALSGEFSWLDPAVGSKACATSEPALKARPSERA